MGYLELEQFLGRGNEKVFWVLSLKDLCGMALGGFIGQRGGEILFGSGMPAMVVALVGAFIGLTLMMQYHGLIIGRRLVLLLRFYGRRLRGATKLDLAAGEPEETGFRPQSHVRVYDRETSQIIFGPRMAVASLETARAPVQPSPEIEPGVIPEAGQETVPFDDDTAHLIQILDGQDQRPEHPVSEVEAPRQPVTPPPPEPEPGRYHYAVDSGGSVFRFAYPSDRNLWVAHGLTDPFHPERRRVVSSNDRRVLAAKKAAQNGEHVWPDTGLT